MSFLQNIKDAYQVLSGKKCLHANTPPVQKRSDHYDFAPIDNDELMAIARENAQQQTSAFSIFGGTQDYGTQGESYRKNYQAFEFMDSGDCSAILDIHAATTVQNSTFMNFRPYELILTPKKSMGVDQIAALKFFIERSEQYSGLFDMLYGLARDGFKYGAAYEKARFGRITEGETIVAFDSLETPSVYPLHNDNMEVTEYYYRSSDYDYYHRDNFLKPTNNKTRTKQQKTTQDKVYNENIIFAFINGDRSFEWVGRSILEPAIDAFTCLHISQSKLLSQRLTHSTQKILHKFEIQGLMDSEIEKKVKLLRKYNQKFKQVKRLDSKFIQSQQDIDMGTDIISFTNDGKGGAEVVRSDADISNTRDVDLWRQIQYTVTHTPASFIIDSSLSGGNRDMIVEQDKMFESIISKGRKRLEIGPLTKYYNTLIDLFFQREGAHELFTLEYKWLPISNLDALRREKVQQVRQMIAKSYRLDLDIPDEHTFQKVLKMSKEECEELKKMEKPNPLFYKAQLTPPAGKGENTTSPKTGVNPKKPKEIVQSISNFVKYVVDNQNHLDISDITLIEQHIDLLREELKK